MYVTKEKLGQVVCILVAICIVLAIGFLITGKVPDEIFNEKKDSKESYTNRNMDYAKTETVPDTTSGTPSGSPDENTKYDQNKYDVQYHDSIDDIKIQSGINNNDLNNMIVKNVDGNLVSIPFNASTTLPTYYTPGSFIHGSSTYVPNYKDSVYLSRTTGISSVSPVYPSSMIASGFCNYYKNDAITIEQKCNQLDPGTCGSVSCCVLLGGRKCVSGDEKGPIMKSNYTDDSILNKDVYYYQGKCYGNCQ